MHFPILFLIFLLSLPYISLCDDIVVDDPDTHVLTDANFDTFIEQELTLVEFYAPWCGHCKSLAPEYAKAATALLKENIPIGKLDATKATASAGKHSISGYPTLKVFRNGKSSDYNGPRTADGIVAYMKKQVGPAAKSFSTQAELDKIFKLEREVGYTIVAFFNDAKQTQLQSSFSLLSTRMRDDFVFAKTTDATLHKKYGVDDGNEKLIAFLHGEKIEYEGGSKTSEVEAFIKANSLPLVGEFNDKTSPIYQKRGLPVAKLFMKVDRNPKSKTMTYYTNRLKKLAKDYEGKVIITYADKDAHKQALEYFNLQDEEHGFVLENGQESYKYESDDDKPVKGLDTVGWNQFISNYLDGKLKTYVKSQKAPKNNLSLPVKIITGQNFQEIVEDDDKDVFIEFYAPWCGHCKQLSPIWDKLGEKFKSQSSITIAKIDATANDYDRSKWKVEGYPTLFFKAAGREAKLYDGTRELDALSKYVNKNARTIKKKKSKKN